MPFSPSSYLFYLQAPYVFLIILSSSISSMCSFLNINTKFYNHTEQEKFVNDILVKISCREYIFCALQKFVAGEKSGADSRHLGVFH